ncbi:hypothetical protein LTR22_026968, partial [Elasticomyces elasticus]
RTAIKHVLMTIAEMRAWRELLVQGAEFDPEEDEYKETCLSNTRVDLLQQVEAWANDSTGENMFWLSFGKLSSAVRASTAWSDVSHERLEGHARESRVPSDQISLLCKPTKWWRSIEEVYRIPSGEEHVSFPENKRM